MKLTIRATILYFPLILFYKLFADNYTNYWVCAYWLVTAIYFMVVFIDIRKNCVLKMYRRIAATVCFYWGVMAILRVYLLFNIEQYYKLVTSVCRLTVGGIAIIIILIYLTAQIWHRK